MYVDSYCERTAPGLWNEPANALSNLAFLIASATLIRLLLRGGRPAPASVWLLPLLLGVVGLASLSFHTFANVATEALDSLSILAFILTGVVVYAYWMWGVAWRWAWLAAPGFFAFMLAMNLVWGGLGGYLPALVGLAGIGLAIRYTGLAAARPLGWWLLGVAGLFAVSLTMRTLDEPLCDRFPLGTHFLWHCLNATVLFGVAYPIWRRWRDES